MNEDLKIVKPTVVIAGEIRMARLRAEEGLSIIDTKDNMIVTHIVNPAKNSVILRQWKGGELGELENVAGILGSGPFKAGYPPATTRIPNPQLQWGLLRIGDELVFQNENGLILYTNLKIARIDGRPALVDSAL